MKRRSKAIQILLVVSIVACNKVSENSAPNTGPMQILVANVTKVTHLINGYYSSLPVDYFERDVQFPLIIYLHGGAQLGDGDSLLFAASQGGIPRVIKDNLFPSTFNSNGGEFSFIVLAPQFTAWPQPKDVVSFISYATLKYRIDTRRIYLSGLSGGGILATEVASNYPQLFAAVVPMAGVLSGVNAPKRCERIAKSSLPLWIFQNTDDMMFDYRHSITFVSLVASFRPKINPRYTQTVPYGINGHDAWTKASDPTYQEEGMNIYEWMLQYTNER